MNNEKLKDLEYIKNRAQKRLLESIANLRDQLNEAESRIKQNRLPNSCGIIQRTGSEIEIILGELIALEDIAQTLAVYKEEE